MKTYQQSQDALIVRNPIPFALTEANVENVNPTACAGGVNPHYDAAQRRHEKTDTGKAPTYANAVHALASRIADKHVRQARMRCEHLRGELVTEAESAIGEFIGVRVSRFPTLAQDLLVRFAVGALPSSTNRAMHRCARRACDARMSRMGGRSKLVEPSFFNLFCDDSAERSAELDTVFVNSRIDYLLGLVRERGAKSGNANRAAQAHAKLLEDARTYFLASIRGEAVALPSAGLNPVAAPVGFNVCRTYRGKTLVESVGQVVTEQRDARLSSGALYKRVSRLASFVGAADIQDSLARGMKTHG